MLYCAEGTKRLVEYAILVFLPPPQALSSSRSLSLTLSLTHLIVDLIYVHEQAEGVKEKSGVS
jgi:hypothetical protein